MLLGREPSLVFRVAVCFGMMLTASTAKAGCVTTATGVSFGSYHAQAPTPDDAAGAIGVSCDNNSPQIVTISIGTGSSGSYTARRMSSGGNALQYNLFSDPSRLQVWGDGTAGTATVTLSFRRSASATVYGRIPTNQLVQAGTYGDTIFVTVEY